MEISVALKFILMHLLAVKYWRILCSIFFLRGVCCQVWGWCIFLELKMKMCVLRNSAGLICYLKVQENLFSPLQLWVLWYDPFDSFLMLCEMKLSFIVDVLMWLHTVRYIFVCHASVWGDTFIPVPFPRIFFICRLKYNLILYWDTVWYLTLPLSTGLCTNSRISKLQLW